MQEMYKKIMRIAVPIATTLLIGALLIYNSPKTAYVPESQQQISDPNESELEEMID